MKTFSILQEARTPGIGNMPLLPRPTQSATMAQQERETWFRSSEIQATLRIENEQQGSFELKRMFRSKCELCLRIQSIHGLHCGKPGQLHGEYTTNFNKSSPNFVLLKPKLFMSRFPVSVTRD